MQVHHATSIYQNHVHHLSVADRSFPSLAVEPTALQLMVTFLEKAGCIEGQVRVLFVVPHLIIVPPLPVFSREKEDTGRLCPLHGLVPPLGHGNL